MNLSQKSVIPASAKSDFIKTLQDIRSGDRSVLMPEGYLSPDQLSALPKSAPLLLGFSGGIDSSVLLFLTYLCSISENHPLHLVHLHHGIRGEEADRDASFVKEMAELYGLPITIIRKDVPSIAKEREESLETAARLVRYETFEEVMREYGIEFLLTAHNADDNLETVLFHLLRGSGLSGLCGIPPVRELMYGTVLRPLLSVSREAIEAFATDYKIPFVYDQTNGDTAYTRNRLRHEIIPRLRSISQNPEKAVVRLSSSLRRDKLYLDSESDTLLSRARSHRGLDRTLISSTPDAVALRALLSYWKEVVPELDSYSSHHLEALLSFARNGRDGTHLALRMSVATLEGKYLLIQKSTSEEVATVPADFRIDLRDGETHIPEFGVTLFLGSPEEAEKYCKNQHSSLLSKKEKNIYNLSTQIALPFDTIEKQLQGATLSVRPRKAGDRILCRGMHRSLRTLLNEKRIPKKERRMLPIIVSGDEILWIPGVAVRDGILANPAQDTRHKVLLLIRQAPHDGSSSP